MVALQFMENILQTSKHVHTLSKKNKEEKDRKQAFHLTIMLGWNRRWSNHSRKLMKKKKFYNSLGVWRTG